VRLVANATLRVAQFEISRAWFVASPPVSKLTVHLSPYAERIYRKMGFNQIGDLTTEHGITYVPMELDLRSCGSPT